LCYTDGQTDTMKLSCAIRMDRQIRWSWVVLYGRTDRYDEAELCSTDGQTDTMKLSCAVWMDRQIRWSWVVLYQWTDRYDEAELCCMDGQTDMMKLIITFCNFMNTPKNKEEKMFYCTIYKLVFF